MKSIYVPLTILLIMSILFVPLIAFEGEKRPPSVDEQLNEPDTFEVYFPDTDEIKTMPAKDYVWSVVAAEMPANYDTEALKAQAVAAYTFAKYRKAHRDHATKSYDVAADHTTDQAYVSIDKAKENWGEEYDTKREKISEAVEAVLGQYMTYNDEIIMAAYFSCSSGKTEDCIDIWGGDKDYLVSVDSEWDKKSEKYLAKTEISADDIKEKLKDICDFVPAADAFAINARTDAGSVLSVTICGKTIKGTELRSLLGLRSANFEIEYNEANKTYTFTTRGYGHGIGMSQVGAAAMAAEGYDYEEILKHYYTGVKIKK